MRKIIAKIIDVAVNEEDVEQISQMFQESLQKFRTRLLAKNRYRSLDETQLEEILDLAENYVMTKCHCHLFCPLTTQDEHKDRLLQNRVRKLQRISAIDLGSIIDEENQIVRELLQKTIDDLLQLDCRCTPSEKLDLVSTCCRRIFQMLESTSNQPVSADHFLPTLIYVCIKANLPRFHSNVNFVLRFRRQQCLNMGQSAFFFANFCSALAFIEDMTSSNSLETIENQTLPSDNLSVSPKTSSAEHRNASILGDDLRTLEKIRVKQERVLRESQQLREKMRSFKNHINNEVAVILRELSIVNTANEGYSAFSDDPRSNN